MSVGLTPTIGVQGSSWTYTDNDTALAGSTTYTWIATNKYQGATKESGPSAAFTGTTTAGRANEKTIHVSTSKH